MEPAAILDQEDAFHALKCPGCQEISVPPVTLCKRGHLICNICRKTLEKCVTCQEDYTDLRCQAVENIVSKINVKCRYNPCNARHNLEKLEEHLEHCDYRPVICNCKLDSVCVEKPIEFAKFVGHLMEFHGAISPNGRTQYLISCDERKWITAPKQKILPWRSLLHTYDRVKFIQQMAVEDAVVYFYVSAMSSQPQLYFADIHIGKLLRGKINCDSENIKWTVRVVSPRATLENVKESGDCVVLPASRLISVSGTNPNEDKKFSFYVELNLRK